MLDTFYLHPFQPTLLIFKGSTLGYLTAPSNVSPATVAEFTSKPLFAVLKRLCMLLAVIDVGRDLIESQLLVVKRPEQNALLQKEKKRKETCFD